MSAKHSDADVKCLALYALSKIPNESRAYAVEIADMLGDTRLRVKSCATQALANMGGEAAPVFVKYLNDSDPDVRRYAARGLASIWRKQNDSPRENRHSAATFDEMAGYAVPGLMPLVRDADQTVAEAASEALIAIGAPSVGALRELLTAAEKDEDRRRVAYILDKIGPASKNAIPELLLVAAAEGPVNAEAIIAVINSGHELAEISRIHEILSGDYSGSMGKVASALAKRGGEAVPYFVEMLGSKNPRVRSLAAASLGFMGVQARTAVPLLLGTLTDADMDVRCQGARAMSFIGPDESAVPALLEAIRDNDGLVIVGIEDTIKKIGAPAVPFVLDAIEKNRVDAGYDPLASGCFWPASIHPAFARSMFRKPKECSWYWYAWMLRHVLRELRGDERPGMPAGVLSKDEAARQEGILSAFSGSPRLEAAEKLARHSPDSFPKVIPVLMELSESDQRYFKLKAIELLGEIGSPAKAAVPALRRKLREDQSVKVYAAFALWKIEKSRKAVAVLVASLGSKDDDVKLYCMEKLEEIGANAGEFLPQIRKLLRSENFLVKNGALKLLAKAKGNLGKALPELIGLLDYRNDSGIQETAAKLIGGMGARASSAIPKLTEGLNSKYGNEIERSASALAGIGLPAVPGLIAALRSDKENTSEGAALALGKIGPSAKDAIPALIEAIGESRNLRVRGTFERSMQQIDPVPAGETGK